MEIAPVSAALPFDRKAENPLVLAPPQTLLSSQPWATYNSHVRLFFASYFRSTVFSRWRLRTADAAFEFTFSSLDAAFLTLTYEVKTWIEIRWHISVIL